MSKEKHEYELARQILRSGTSIGANVCGAVEGQSKADFTAKLSVALKEASETRYWLELLFETEYISRQEFESLQNDCGELVKILASIIRTIKQNHN